MPKNFVGTGSDPYHHNKVDIESKLKASTVEIQILYLNWSPKLQ